MRARNLVPLFFISLLSISISCVDNQKKQKISIKDFFRNPEKTSFQLSPDGNSISFLEPYEKRLNIVVQNLETNIATRVTSETSRNVGQYFWVGNNELVYLKDEDGDENFRLIAVKADGTDLRDITPFDGVKIRMVKTNKRDDKTLLIAMNKRDSSIFDVYRLDTRTSKLTMVCENLGNFHYWKLDNNGKLLLVAATDGVNQSLLYRKTEESPFKTIITTDFKNSIQPIAFSENNEFIYASSNFNRDKQAIVLINLKTGKEVKEIFSHKDVDVSEAGFSENNERLLYAAYTTWKYQMNFLDDSARLVYEKIAMQLPGKEISILEQDTKKSKILVRTFSDKSLGSFYLYNIEENKLKKLSDVSPWLKEEDMCDMKAISYKSRDGKIINGYLTLPKGVDAKNLPVIINPHGGPWNRNRWGFNPEVQFLANRGYAVLQMNFRGSTGYGREFWQASFHEWGLTMQDDITDGARWLINSGIADSTRIGIYGYSFGGYAALAGVTYTPGLYRCAVSYCGISNIFTYIKDIPPYYKQFLSMVYEMVGHPERDANYFRSVSPVFHTEKIKVPVMIAQGEKDPRVNVNETRQLVKALKKGGVEVTYFLKKNEGHGFVNEENKLEFYAEVEKFLAENLQVK